MAIVRELEQKIKDYLGVKHCLFVSNGTIAIQLALKVLGVTKEVITTPFSYCATSHSVVWEGCTPVFADILRSDLCIDPQKLKPQLPKYTSNFGYSRIWQSM
jgi:dTDP-4-amino-4,6-dideoxygalactose transaminase